MCKPASRCPLLDVFYQLKSFQLIVPCPFTLVKTLLVKRGLFFSQCIFNSAGWLFLYIISPKLKGCVRSLDNSSPHIVLVEDTFNTHLVLKFFCKVEHLYDLFIVYKLLSVFFTITTLWIIAFIQKVFFLWFNIGSLLCCEKCVLKWYCFRKIKSHIWMVWKMSKLMIKPRFAHNLTPSIVFQINWQPSRGNFWLYLLFLRSPNVCWYFYLFRISWREKRNIFVHLGAGIFWCNGKIDEEISDIYVECYFNSKLFNCYFSSKHPTFFFCRHMCQKFPWIVEKMRDMAMCTRPAIVVS